MKVSLEVFKGLESILMGKFDWTGAVVIVKTAC
jgi:hypothetical protein